MQWIEKPQDLDADLLAKFENFINNIESTWNLLSVRIVNINGKNIPKIAVSNVGYIGLQSTNHGFSEVAIILAERDLDNEIAENVIAFCKLDPTSRDYKIKKYNTLFNRGINIIYKTITTALQNAYKTAKD